MPITYKFIHQSFTMALQLFHSETQDSFITFNPKHSESSQKLTKLSIILPTFNRLIFNLHHHQSKNRSIISLTLIFIIQLNLTITQSHKTNSTQYPQLKWIKNKNKEKKRDSRIKSKRERFGTYLRAHQRHQCHHLREGKSWSFFLSLVFVTGM